MHWLGEAWASVRHWDVEHLRLRFLRLPLIAGKSSPARRNVAFCYTPRAFPPTVPRQNLKPVRGVTLYWLGETWVSVRFGDAEHLRLKCFRLPLIAGKSSPARRNVALLFYARALPPTIPRQNLKPVRGGKSHWLGETWCFVRF